MSVTAEEDLVRFASIRVNRDGIYADRAIRLAGFDGTALPYVLGQTYPRAGGGADVAIPTWGSEHPTIPGVLCFDVTQKPWAENSRSGLLVIAQYGPADLVSAWKITVSGSGQFKDLSVDDTGQPLLVLKYPNPDASASDGSDAKFVDYGTAEYLSAGSVVTFECDIASSPWNQIKTYKACTNSAPFLGFPAHKVLCRDIQAESFVSATRWHVKYIFDIDPGKLGWQSASYYHDPFTGKVPSNVSGTNGSNGVLIVDPYQLTGRYADFTALGLPTALLTG